MKITETDLSNMMQLAYLNTDSDNCAHLNKDVNAIMDFVAQLCKVDTAGVRPLFHPFDLQQRLREDRISEKDCRLQLAKLAPLFEEGYYLVPKVIDSGQ